MTSSIVFKDLIFFIDFKGLKTLKPLKNLTFLSLVRKAANPAKTIMKSNLFQLS